jgi:Xaa-Pro aminopeptidase
MEKRINQVRRKMEKEKLDGLLIEAPENRYYLTGFTGSAGRVLFTPENNYFITDFRYTEQAGKQITGYSILEINQKFEEELADLVKEEGIKNLGFEAGVVTFEQYEKYQDSLKGVELVPTNKLVKELRLIKDSQEIAKIKKAVAITDRAFEYILGQIKPGITEKELALELEFYLKKQGGEKNAFDFIVASGKRSSLPHGVASDKKLEAGDFITFDFGTFYQGYCSDLTRTVVLGKPDNKQKEVYDIVLTAQLAVIEQIKPEMSCQEVDGIAREIIKKAGYGDNFGHGLGHGIGLEVHEGPRVSYTSEDVLEPGMVVTDEPGIYIPDWGGVRIEDDLLITETGCEVLNSAPKELISL